MEHHHSSSKVVRELYPNAQDFNDNEDAVDQSEIYQDEDLPDTADNLNQETEYISDEDATASNEEEYEPSPEKPSAQELYYRRRAQEALNKKKQSFRDRMSRTIQLFLSSIRVESLLPQAYNLLLTLIQEMERSELAVGSCELEDETTLARHSLLYYLLQARFEQRNTGLAQEIAYVILKNARVVIPLAIPCVVFTFSNDNALLSNGLLGFVAAVLVYGAILLSEKNLIPWLASNDPNLSILDAMIQHVAKIVANEGVDKETYKYIKKLHKDESVGAIVDCLLNISTSRS